ncbi:hypothetical protein C1N73_26385 (plasmid) [Priestia aryabhattai]
MLVPAFLDNLFSSEAEKNSITNAFKTYKDRLLELPILQKNLEDFKVAGLHADQIIDATKAYIDVKQDLEDAQVYMSQLYNTIVSTSQNNKVLLEEIKAEIGIIQEKKLDLDWKIDSYQVKLAEISLGDAINHLKSMEKQDFEMKKQISYLQNRISELKAARHYEEYKNYQTKFYEMEANLKVAELEAGERTKVLENLREKVSGEFAFIKNDLNQKRKYYQGLTGEKVQNLKVVKNKLKDIQNKVTAVQVEKGQLVSHISSFDRELLNIKVLLKDRWKNEVLTTKKTLSEEFSKLDTLIVASQLEIENVEQKLMQVNSDEHTSISQSQGLQRELRETEEKFEKFSNQEIELKNDVSKYLSILIHDNLFENKELVISKLDRMKNDFEQEIIKEATKYEHRKTLRKSVEQTGYHIHPEIELVKQYLSKKSIYVMSGAEWLINSTLSEKKKKEIISKNPLLTFSLLLNENEINEASRVLSSFKEELTIPVFFLNKQKLEIPNEKSGFIHLDNNIHLYHNFNVRLTESDWEEWANQLDSEMEACERKRVELKDKLKRYQTFEMKLENFWEHYNSDSRANFSNSVKELQKELEIVEANKVNLENKRSEFLEKKEKMNLKVNSIREEIGNLNNFIFKLNDFAQRYENIEEEAKLLKQLQIKIEKLAQDEQNAQDEILNLELEKEKSEQHFNKLGSELEGITRDFDEYHFISNVTIQSTNKEQYEKNKLYFKKLINGFSAEQNQLNEIRNRKNEYQKLTEKEVLLIKENGFEITFFESNLVSYDKSLLGQLQEELNSLEEENQQIKKRYEKAKHNHISKKTVFEGIVDRIFDTYNKNHFEFSTDHKEEVQYFKNQKAATNEEENAIHLKKVDIDNKEIQFENTITQLESFKEYFLTLAEDSLYLEDDRWDMTKPFISFNSIRKTFERTRDQLREKDNIIKNKIEKLREDIEKTGNTYLIGMSHNFANVLESSRGNYDEMIKNFYSVLEATDAFKESIEFQRSQSEEGRNELIEMMYDRAELLYKNICELKKYSEIEEKGEVVPLFTIRWEKNDVLDAKNRLREYVDQLLEELVELQNSGETKDNLERRFEEKVNIISILNCYAEIDRCILKALKPRNEQIAENKEYFLWDEVSGWSNGEKHASRMAMFITINSLVRKKRFSQENSWKFLIADNPFGEASADHVVKPMITLAKKSNTQLFCLTGIEDKKIQMEFDTVISNKYIGQRGILVLHSESRTKDSLDLETFYYSKTR